MSFTDFQLKFSILKTSFGYLKVSDGSTLLLRVAITNIRKTSEDPVMFSVEFFVRTSIYQTSSKVLEEIKNYEEVKPGEQIKEGWVLLDILEKKNPIEVATYEDYTINVEIEPLMVYRNIKYKNNNIPIYMVNFVPKISWSKKEGTA